MLVGFKSSRVEAMHQGDGMAADARQTHSRRPPRTVPSKSVTDGACDERSIRLDAAKNSRPFMKPHTVSCSDITPMPRYSGGLARTASPKAVTAPDDVLAKPVIIRSSVAFTAPLGPRRPVIPGRMSKLKEMRRALHNHRRDAPSLATSTAQQKAVEQSSTAFSTSPSCSAVFHQLPRQDSNL